MWKRMDYADNEGKLKMNFSSDDEEQEDEEMEEEEGMKESIETVKIEKLSMRERMVQRTKSGENVY